jgi:hypothetical protein
LLVWWFGCLVFGCWWLVGGVLWLRVWRLVVGGWWLVASWWLDVASWWLVASW